MSTVAWDGKVLAADRQSVGGSGCRREVSKIKKISDGSVLAVTGGFAEGLMMMQWYEDGADPSKYPSFQSDKDDWCRLIVVKPDLEVIEYEMRPVALRFKGLFKAWGSGMEYALGAMATGVSAITAVEIASRFDINTGIGVESYIPGRSS